MTNGNGVDTFVNSPDTFLAVDVHEGGHGTVRLDSGFRHVGLGDFDGFHTGAETHGSIGLSNTTCHSSGDTSGKFTGAEGAGVPFGFGGDEEEDGTFGGGFDPGPWDKSLVNCGEILSAAIPADC